MSVSPDGKLAFLKPKSKNWQALDKNSFAYWRDRKLNKITDLVLPPTDDGISSADNEILKENRSQLNDILLRSLQLPNLAFFAGSGTSLGEVGGPSMWDLWKYCMFESPLSTDGNECSCELSETASNVCKKVNYNDFDNPNIEYFLSQCDAFLSFHEDLEVSTFLTKVKDIILNMCRGFILEQNSDLSAYKMLLQKMARRRVRDPRLKVFTTNYDMTFETSASELGMMVVDGLSYTGKRKFDGKYFNYDVIMRDENEHEFVEGVFQLYKVHGSVSWVREGTNIYENNFATADSVCLIYPAKGKYQQAFLQPHLELLSRFLDSLRKKNCCLIISGFGFNDDHLSEPIYSAIKSNPSMKLIIADYKCASHIESNENKGSSKYWRLFKELSQNGYDIYFINGSFKEFTSLIPNLKALTAADQLAKVIKQV